MGFGIEMAERMAGVCADAPEVTNGKLKLAIGYQADGYISIAPDQSAKLTYEDGSVSEIRVSRTLERYPHAMSANIIAEWMRVLKEHGKIVITVTDFDKVCALYASDKSTAVNIEELVYGRQGESCEAFGSCYNEAKMRSLFHFAGGRSVIRLPDDGTVSLTMQAEKAKRYKLTGVGGIMSMPRLDFTDCATAVMDVTFKFGIGFLRRQGTNWGQTMTRALEGICNDSSKRYALTVDFDTLFTPDDVEELYRIIEENPHIDALAGLQMIREADFAIVSVKKNETENSPTVSRADLHSDAMPVATAHFGLTMIRLDSLRKLPRPWFVHVPDADGRWDGPGKIDDDINFWRKWEEAGFTLYQANLVRLGHMELVAKWPDRNLKPLYQGMNDYRANGKPQEVSAW